MADEEEKSYSRFDYEIDLFINHVDAIAYVLVGGVIAIQEITEKAKKEKLSFEEEHCKIEEEKNQFSSQKKIIVSGNV